MERLKNLVHEKKIWELVYNKFFSLEKIYKEEQGKKINLLIQATIKKKY